MVGLPMAFDHRLGRHRHSPSGRPVGGVRTGLCTVLG
jgi:hypothetical protein